jgi:hypothetical protein
MVGKGRTGIHTANIDILHACVSLKISFLISQESVEDFAKFNVPAATTEGQM